MKTILVTGGKGFIGSHFIELALEKGYRVINFDKETYASNLDFNPSSKFYSSRKTDIKSIKTIPHCDFVVNFAAESHVDASIENSDPFINSNVLGVYNLLEILRKNKVKNLQFGWEYKLPRFLQISTDEVFGDIEEGFFLEGDCHNPTNPYSGTKSAAESLIFAWSKTFGFDSLITRTTNNYGERQHPEKLIPKCITNILEGKKIPIQGSGEAIRNWIYVKDNCDAILKVMEQGKAGNSYNISSNEEYSVLQVVSIILEKFGKSVSDDTVEFVPDRNYQDIRYGLDSSKITKELGWKQENKLTEVLDKIIASYRK